MASAEGRPKFGKRTAALEIVLGLDLSSKTFFITGANSGIGYETSRALALEGAHVVMGCRNLEKANEAREKILKEKPDAKIDIIQLDNANLQSVYNCVAEYLAKGWPLHCLILNAGCYAPNPRYTADELESTFQSNHLSHFLLANLLTPLLIANAPSRIVIVSSDAHRTANFFKMNPDQITWDFLSPRDPKRVNQEFAAYGISKLCNIWHAKALQSRLGDKGVTVVSLHPGIIRTNIQNGSKFLQRMMGVLKPLQKTIEQGAATTVYCAVSPDITPTSGGGLYYSDCRVVTPTGTATNPANAEKLWTLSEQMLKEIQEKHGANWTVAAK